MVHRTGSLQALQTLGMGPARPQRADIEGSRSECCLQGRIVDLGIMGQRHDGGALVRLDLVQNLIGPIGPDVDI